MNLFSQSEVLCQLVMAKQKRSATINWEIRNFSALLKVKQYGKYTVRSPPKWMVEYTKGRGWKRLGLFACHYNSKIEFIVDGSELQRARFEMSFISSCGVVQLKKDPYRTYGFYIMKNELFDRNRQSILLNDTMTLCCRMWEETLKTSEFKFITVFHSLNHLWTIAKLDSSDTHDTLFEQENFKLHFPLTKNRRGDWKVTVGVKPYAPDDLSVVDCALSAKDNCGRDLDYIKTFLNFGECSLHISNSSDITGVTLQLELIVALRGRPELSASSQVVRETQLKPNSPTNIARHELPASSQVVRETQLKPNSPTNISRHELPASSQAIRETQLKPNSPTDIAKHELPASSQVVGETQLKPNSPTNIARHELPASSQAVRKTQLKPNFATNIAKHKNVSGALGDDFLLLYRESALSDATLNTEGKSFSAHRTVLAARSPVFRAKFEKDKTSEGQSGVVNIDDVDSETVDRMLVYLYADSVGDLAWKEASALYYAADKYEILPLKEKCADFLKDCLTPYNACDVLVLAVRHKDQELFTRVVNFIFGHEEVLSSAKWEVLEKSIPRLCARITRGLFLKKGRKKMRVGTTQTS